MQPTARRPFTTAGMHEITIERRPTAGPVSGTRGQVAGVAAFLGIPYALPPIGNRRWKPAEPIPTWGTVRFVNRMGPAAMQAPLPQATILSHPDWPMSEDCLYLNVWTASEPDAERPVMVWIHGGGYVSGSTAYPEYDGSALASKGVVVVSIAYRVGPFGFFCHPELAEESPIGVSGNYGLTDMIEALRWVQRNIEAFGGNPDCVTIFGESAGGWAVNQLQVSPLAKGLFHRAIGQSGSSMSRMRCAFEAVDDAPAVESIHRKWATDVGAPNLAALRDMPATAILQAWIDHQMPSEAVVDGWILPHQVREIFQRGEQNRVPVLVGFNSDELELFGSFGLIPVPESKEEYEDFVRQRMGGLAEEFLSHFPPSDLRASSMQAFRDGLHGGLTSMEGWARHNSAAGDATYAYLFSHKPADDATGLGACHMAEIPFVFGNVQSKADFVYPVLAAGPLTQSDLDLADSLSDRWVYFAEHGRFDPASNLHWPQFCSIKRSYLHIDDRLSVSLDPYPGRYEMLERVRDAFIARGRFRNQIFDPRNGGFGL